MVCQFRSNIFIGRPLSAVEPASVTDNLGGRYHRAMTCYISVTKEGLTAEIGLTIKHILWNWHTIYPTSHHDELELPLFRGKINNFFFIAWKLSSQGTWSWKNCFNILFVAFKNYIELVRHSVSSRLASCSLWAQIIVQHYLTLWFLSPENFSPDGAVPRLFTIHELK